MLGIPLRQGRLFTASDDAAAPRVCAISAAFAARFFPGESPIGRRLVFGFAEPVPREIVGIVADVKRDGLGAPSKPEMYVPFAQEPWWAAYVSVRTPGDPGRLASAVRGEIRALAPTLPIEALQPMTDIVRESVAEPRFRTTLVGFFAGTALLLAVVGIYGVISYGVERRTREVGIRVALGAGKGDVLRLIVRQGLALTGLGLAAGAAGALLLTQFLSSLLFETGRLDLPTFAGVALLLAGAGLLACWIPARRAARVDPVIALRFE